MKPVAKDGSAIYPQVFAKLEATGRQLEALGYVERGRRPNLFVRDYRAVQFYADFGGTEFVPLWRDPRPPDLRALTLSARLGDLWAARSDRFRNGFRAYVEETGEYRRQGLTPHSTSCRRGSDR